MASRLPATTKKLTTANHYPALTRFLHPADCMKATPTHGEALYLIPRRRMRGRSLILQGTTKLRDKRSKSLTGQAQSPDHPVRLLSEKHGFRVHMHAVI